ncbi:MAG TPA: Fis family transcriptional regulator, partial [Methylophaga sp.]|nr:Fis family transcriptional regulator [Methylophaga sp.]
VEHLPTELIQPNETGSIEKQIKSTSLFKTMNEQNQLESALAKHNGNISKTAIELGIHRTTLWRKLKKFNIDIKHTKSSK